MQMFPKALILLAALAGLIACGEGSESTAEQDRRAEEYAESLGEDVDVRTLPDGGTSVTVKRSMGEVEAQTGTDLKIPNDFPEDVPVYPQMKIVSVSRMPGAGFMLQGQSEASFDAVGAFFEAEMKTRGWQSDGSQQIAGMMLYQFKKESRGVSVSLFQGDDGTTVQIAAMPAP